MTTKSKTILAAAAAAIAVVGTLGAGASDAEARGGKRFFVASHKIHHGHGHHFRHRHAFIVATPVVYSGGGCGFYKRRWENTGSYHWKAKYYDCMGW